MMELLAWLIAGFGLGALPFSPWLGRWLLHTDIRRYGDQNPGATNVYRAGSLWVGSLALGLDILKGAAPVGAAHLWAGLNGWPLVAVALTPILGHIYSPWLGLRGGKGVAVSLGVWIGLTVWSVPLVGGLSLLTWYLVVVVDGWAVLLAMGSILLFLIWSEASGLGTALRPALIPDLLGVWSGNLLLLIGSHRRDLTRTPGLRRWWRRSPVTGEKASR